VIEVVLMILGVVRTIFVMSRSTIHGVQILKVAEIKITIQSVQTLDSITELTLFPVRGEIHLLQQARLLLAIIKGKGLLVISG